MNVQQAKKLKPGQRVLLSAFEDQPEQKATILEGGEYCNGVVGVEVKPDKNDLMDDGIREVTIDQIVRVL